MLHLGVTLVAVSLLFAMTTLALGAAGKLGHPFRLAWRSQPSSWPGSRC